MTRRLTVIEILEYPLFEGHTSAYDKLVFSLGVFFFLLDLNQNSFSNIVYLIEQNHTDQSLIVCH